jgi:serine/threonine-protein kinase
MKALARDRDERYATCQEFADELESAAKAAGTMASSREVATYVGEVIGQDIAQQREAVRAWLARSEPSQAMPADMVELPHATVPPELAGLPRAGAGEQSGMVPSPLGAPHLETGGRSNSPLVIAAAAAAGFVIVGLIVVLLRREQSRPPVVVVQPALPAATVQPPEAPATVESAAAPATPTVTAPVAQHPAPQMPSEELPAPSPRGAPRYYGRPQRSAPPSPPAGGPAAAKTAKPAEPAGGGDVDLSNPYR